MKEKVLVLDDDVSICKIYTIMLEKLDVMADTVLTGEEAVQRYAAARRAGTPYAAVFLDLTVQEGMGGLATLKQLKAINPNIYAIVSSGASRETTQAHYHAQGFSDSLPKPFRLQDVADCITRMKAAVAP